MYDIEWYKIPKIFDLEKVLDWSYREGDLPTMQI